MLSDYLTFWMIHNQKPIQYATAFDAMSAVNNYEAMKAKLFSGKKKKRKKR